MCCFIVNINIFEIKITEFAHFLFKYMEEVWCEAVLGNTISVTATGEV